MTDASEKIRVALVITELNIGGAERMFTELAVRLDRTRFEPVVYSLQVRPDDKRPSCVPALVAAGIETHFLEMKPGWVGLLTVPWGRRKLQRLLKHQQPHLVLSFLFHANYLCRRVAAAWGKATPRPKFLAGIRVAEQGKCWHRWLDRLTRSSCDHWVCVSQSVAGFCRWELHLPDAEITVIPNGIDPRPFQQATPADLSGMETIPGSKKALFVGRLHYQKGLDWLLATLPGILARLDDWEILLVGGGPEKKALMTQIDTKIPENLRRRIHLSGWREDIPELLAASQLFILPSRWEGMPNVVLQAMAAGRAVLATDAEGVAELLDDPRQIVPFGDTARWSSRFVEMARSDELRHVLGLCNQDRAARHFTLPAMVDAYEKLFLKMAAAASE